MKVSQKIVLIGHPHKKACKTTMYSLNTRSPTRQWKCVLLNASPVMHGAAWLTVIGITVFLRNVFMLFSLCRVFCITVSCRCKAYTEATNSNSSRSDCVYWQLVMRSESAKTKTKHKAYERAWWEAADCEFVLPYSGFLNRKADLSAAFSNLRSLDALCRH